MAGDRAPYGEGEEGLQIAIGRLGRPHGVKGELKLHPFFGEDLAESFIGETLVAGESPGNGPVRLALASVRGSGQTQLVAFEGIDTPEQAAALTNRNLLAPRRIMPDLPKGHYYHEEVVGLPVYDPEGRLLGRLTGFFSAGVADVWTIATQTGGELMIPCLPETLLKVDLLEGRIVMKPMEME